MTEPAQQRLIDELRERRAEGRSMGGPDGIARHHASGRLTVRERIERLIDADSFHEIGLLAKPEFRRSKPIPADAVVTGYAKIFGRNVGLIGIDSSVVAGTTAPVSMRKQSRIIETAQRVGLPIVILCDADGGRIPDVMGWRFSGLPLDFQTFLKTPEQYPTVPRVAAILGPSYGDSALHASTAHFIVMVKSGSVALSGPSVVGNAIGEKVSDETLGGPDMAGAVGNTHMVVEAEDDAFLGIKAFLSYMPNNAAEAAPVAPARQPARSAEAISDLVPADARRGYDMFALLDHIVDEGSLLPYADAWGPSLITALARLDGRVVGIVASQPIEGAGALDPASLTKERQFVDMCDTFNIPLVFLQDVPGLLIGTGAEQSGILRCYEQAVLRIAEAKVPKVVVVLRKAYGGGHFALGGRPTHPDFLYAWPTADMSFMAPDTGLITIHRRKLERAMEEGGQAAYDTLMQSLEQEWSDECAPWESAAHFHLDDVIEPAETRRVIIRSIEIAWGARQYVARKY